MDDETQMSFTHEQNEELASFIRRCQLELKKSCINMELTSNLEMSYEQLYYGLISSLARIYIEKFSGEERQKALNELVDFLKFEDEGDENEKKTN